MYYELLIKPMVHVRLDKTHDPKGIGLNQLCIGYRIKPVIHRIKAVGYGV